MMTEKLATNAIGHILTDGQGRWWFRIYDRYKPGKGYGYTDYKLAAEDIKVTITTEVLSLYEGPEGNRIDWSSKYLGHNETNQNSVETQDTVSE